MNNEENIRMKFGQLVLQQRKSLFRYYNQENFAKTVNQYIDNYSGFTFTQSKISCLENGKLIKSLTEDAILALQKTCKLEDKDIKPMLEILSHTHKTKSTPLITVRNEGNLIVDSSYEEFHAYAGDYYCVFFSTDSSVKKCVHGKMQIAANVQNNYCDAQFQIYDGDKKIKEYSGIFMINNYYNMWYCILIGEKHQEVCFLASSYQNHSIHKNFLNIASVITTSAGLQKRPTMHRMIISRKKISNEKLKLIMSQLRLNNDMIFISEENLKNLEQNIDNHLCRCKSPTLKKRYQAIKNCIQKIYNEGSKKIFYTIDEASLYDNQQLIPDKKLRGYAVSTIRQETNQDYYNKISQTIHTICADIIGK